MDKQHIIDSVVTKLKEAGFKPLFISKPEDSDVIVHFRDTKRPHTKISVVVKATEIAAHGDKIEGVVRNHVRHAMNMLDDRRPVELAAEARRVAEGR